MGAFTYIETDTGTNVDIHAATAVGAYTSTGDKLIMVDVSIDQVAGNGDYVMYVTRQIGGSGSAYVILPKTTMTAASGETAISGQSGWITVRNGDVLTCYVDGLAGDTSTPDWSTRWFELAAVAAPDNAGIAAIQAKTDQLTFTTPNKVDATATIDPTGIATSAELVAVDDKVDEILSKLNSDPLPKIGVGITGSTINAIRGDDFIEALTGVDVLEGAKCQFAIKTRRSDVDNQSLLLVDSETGLIKAKNMLNATSDMAAVTIVGGVYQLEIKAILSRSIPSGSLVWGAQIISAEGQVLEKWGGIWNQIEDTIKAVS